MEPLILTIEAGFRVKEGLTTVERNDAGLDRELQPAELLTHTERLMSHPILTRGGVLPTISRVQLVLAYLIMEKTGLPSGVRNRVISALLLIYHGLGMHDLIPDSIEPQTESGQLTILGGDYLSALFYKLLADAGRVDLIETFSQAIGRMTAAKSALLASEGTANEIQYMNHLSVIRNSLLLGLCRTCAMGEPVLAVVQTAVTASIYEDRMSDQIPVKGMASRLGHSLRECIARLQTLTLECFGEDGWGQVERLFMAVGPGAEPVRVVEGG